MGARSGAGKSVTGQRGGSGQGRRSTAAAGRSNSRRGSQGDPSRSSGGQRGGRRDEGNTDRRRRGPETAGPGSWGGVARRGAGKLKREEREDRPGRDERTAERTTRPRRSDFEEDDRLRREAAEAVARGGQTGSGRSGRRAMAREPLPQVPRRLPEADTQFRTALGDRAGGRASGRLNEAARAFVEERFHDARRILNQLDQRVPRVPEVVELLGLVNYRMGHWRAAVKRLEMFRNLTGSTEQHPVLADSHRAQGRWADVDALWIELRDASPSGPLVTEGRLVAAGALADQGRLAEAVTLLEKGWRVPSRARDHHLRRAYALADLYERSGALPRARELFAWVRNNDPGFADVVARVRSLS